jgi:rubredoxin
MSDDSYMQALLWTCQTCGFVKEGNQPHMECPICEGYKSNFIDIPQHIDQKIREEHPDKNPNHRVCREMRLDLMEEEEADEKNRYAGRVLPTESGYHSDPS